MKTKNSVGLYPWSKDLDASSDVRLREREGFAMLLGWLEKFVAGSGLLPGREACERFWKEQIRAKPREKWQLDQWARRRCTMPGQALVKSDALKTHVQSDS